MTRIRGLVSSKYRRLRFTTKTYGDGGLPTIAPAPDPVLPLSRELADSVILSALRGDGRGIQEQLHRRHASHASRLAGAERLPGLEISQTISSEFCHDWLNKGELDGEVFRGRLLESP